MSYQDNSTFDQQSEMTNLMNAKDVECLSSIKRTPLQTLSPNSPLLLLKSRGISKRRSPLYERFVKVSQSTPIYKSDEHCSTVKDAKQINVTPVLNANRLPSIVPNDVITYGDLSEVSLNTSNFSLLENISIPEVTTSIPSLGQIDLQDESFDIHNDLGGTRSSNDICSTCEESFYESDNKENRADYIYEDISSDDNGDFLFHSRNSDSKIFLVPPLEDDLAIESLDDVEVPSACEKSSSSDRQASSSDFSMCQCQTSGSYAFQKSDSDAYQTSNSGAYETASSGANHTSSSDACPTSSSDISACQTSSSSIFECESSSEFGDNEDSDEASSMGNSTAEDVNYSVEMEQAFACSLQEIQYLIKNGMFLDSSTDDPRYVADTQDGYIPVSLEAYEPEEGETDETETSCSLHLPCDDISDVSGESLSPGEIGSSLFSDNCSLSSSHSSSRRSSACSNLEQDILQTSDSLFQIHQLEGSSDSYEMPCHITYTELDDDDDVNFKTARMRCHTELDDDEDVNFKTARMPHTTDTELDDDDVNFRTARMFLSAETTDKSPVYFRDYGGVCDDLLAEMGEHGVCLTSSSACIQSGDPPLLDVVQESGAASLSDENWSLKVHTDSLVYQNEVDIWDCHALQGDLVDYFGATGGNLLKNDFTESALQPEVSSLDLQEDLEDLSKPSSQLCEIFVDLENNDSGESDYDSVEEQLLDTPNKLLENVIEIHSFSDVVSEENIGSPPEDVTDTTDLNNQPATCVQGPEAISVTDDRKLHNIGNDSPDGCGCSLVASSDRAADEENPARASIVVENLGYAHSDQSDRDDAEDDDDDEWENISYDDEDCLQDFQDSKTKTDTNLASCAGEASLIGGDVKESQTVEALAAVQKEASGRCELSSHPEVSNRSQRSQGGNWRCSIL